MIYLIESSGYNIVEGSVSYFQLLKIGYTEDSKKDRRFNQYKLHNPTCKVLYEIPNGTEDHEKRVQYKFRELIYSEYGREWFYYSEKIVNFFKDIQENGLESVLNLPKGATSKSTYLYYRNKVKDILYSVYGFYREKNNISPKESLEDTMKNYFNKMIIDLGDKITSEVKVLEYIREDFGEIVDNYLENDKLFKTSLKISKFMEGINQLNSPIERLKFFCNYNISDKERKIILNQLGEYDDIKSYYNILGPERLRALGYNSTKIRKELGIVVFSKELLITTIFQNFKVGDRISNISIKDTLVKLYNSINYKASPKATDLGEYFEIKKCKIPVESKRLDGLELIGVKSEYQHIYNNLISANNYIEEQENKKGI